MRKALKRIIDEIYNQAWTIAGTILVLITLSGDIQTWGIWIGSITLVIHLIGSTLKRVNNDNET